MQERRGLTLCFIEVLALNSGQVGHRTVSGDKLEELGSRVALTDGIRHDYLERQTRGVCSVIGLTSH